MSEANSNTEAPVAFGIGSYIFLVTAENKSKWADCVTRTLGNLPSIRDIEIDQSRADVIERGESKFVAMRAVLRFRVHIPQRMHEEFFAPLLSRRNLAEDYTVITYYDLLAQVTYVIADDRGNLSDGAAGVILVREFLIKELALRPGTASFEILGPSPFHVDAVLAGSEQIEALALKVERRRGYDYHQYTFSPERFGNADEALQALLESTKDELILFYYAELKKNHRLIKAAEISTMTAKLIADYQANGFRARIRIFFTAGSQTRSIALKAIAEEYAVKTEREQSQRMIENRYATIEFPCFRDHLESVTSQHFDAQFAVAKEATLLLDHVRDRQVEAAFLLLSALAGGLAGALVSLFGH